jgi:hypothetical protein
MNEDQLSRRSIIKRAGFLSVLSVPGGGSTDPTSTTDELEQLVLGEDHVNDEYVKHSVDFAFHNALAEEDSAFANANTAYAGYIKGDDPKNPRWAVSSAAIQTPTTFDCEVIKDVITTFYDDFVRSYDQETHVQVSFEQDQSHCPDHSDWHYRMTRTVSIGDQRPLTYDLFSERFRVQFFEKTLLITLAFAPVGIVEVPADEMVDKFATVQREQYLESAR